MTTLSILKTRAAVCVSTLTLALSCSFLPAQMPAPRAKVNVPFAFQVGSTHFSPGTYILSSPEDHLLELQNGKRSALAMSSYESTNMPAGVSKVVFHRYGNQYFLREVWMKGNTDYLSCPPSKAEKEARRTQSGSERASATVRSNVEVALMENPR